jgi:ADP-ribose pyrophosphatase
MERWHLTASEQLVKSPWLSLERNSYKIAGDRTISDYYILRRKPFVLIIAQYNENVLLVRQYRPATDKFYLAVPAGFIDEGEEITTAARRELLEETGAEGTDFRVIGTLDPLPGYINSQASIVWCRCLTPPDVTKCDEEVESTETFPWTEVTKMIMSGAINEMQAVSALLLAKEWLESLLS